MLNVPEKTMIIYTGSTLLHCPDICIILHKANFIMTFVGQVSNVAHEPLVICLHIFYSIWYPAQLRKLTLKGYHT